MKTISGALQTHLEGEYLTIATCVKIKRKDGVILGFTDHDQNISINVDSDGITTYEAGTSSYNRTAIQSSSTMSPDNLDVQTLLDSNAITDNDMRNKLYDGAEFKMFQLNWADLSQGIVKLRRGFLGDIKILGPSEAQIEFRGMLQALSRNIVEIIAPECRADLGDGRCKEKGVLAFPEVWQESLTPFNDYKPENTRDANIGDVVIASEAISILVPSGTLRLLTSSPSFINSTTGDFEVIVPTGHIRLLGSVPIVDGGVAVGGFPSGGIHERRFVCIQGGDSGSVEPAWTATIGAVVVDNEVRWRVDDAFRKSSKVTSVINKRKFIDGTMTEPTGHWVDGFVIFTSGPNSGIGKEVKVFASGGTFTLFMEFPFDIQVGDAYDVAIGCNKTGARCKFFKNILNFRGERHVPGNDFIFDFPDAQN